MQDTPASGSAATDPRTRRRQLLVVAGSGRSGTSLFTGLTGVLGWHIPKPEVIANRSNPRGFGEPRWAVDFHNDLLAKVDVNVDDGRPEAWDLTDALVEDEDVLDQLRDWVELQFAEADRVVVKDPRLAWFFALYRRSAADLDADLSVITMLRHPTEVLRSREIAYGTKTNNTTRVMGWANMMLGIEHRSRQVPRAVVQYADLLTDWTAAFQGADATLGLDLLADPARVAEAGELVDHSLHRSVADWDALELPRTTRGLAERVYDAYGRLVGDPEAAEAVQADLDSLREEYSAYFDECFDVARSRTGARVRRERRQTTRRVRQEERDTAEADTSGRAQQLAGGARRRAGNLLRKLRR